MVLLLAMGLFTGGGAMATPAQATARGLSGRIAYEDGSGANTQVFAKNADGSGIRRPLTPATGYLQPTWSPDGTSIAVWQLSVGIVLFPAEGGFPIGTLDADSSDLMPAWSPDGRYIAFNRGFNFVNGGDVWIKPVDLSTGAIHVGPGYSPAWSPDSSQLAYIDSGTIYTVPVLPDVGTPVPRTDPGAVHGLGVSWSPDGARIAFAGAGGAIQYVQLGNLSPTTIFGTAGGWWPAWSPDGRKIAFYDHGSASGGVYTMDLIKNTRTTVSATGYNPAWVACRYRCARR
jgi:Tol biopolymer transport system component